MSTLVANRIGISVGAALTDGCWTPLRYPCARCTCIRRPPPSLGLTAPSNFPARPVPTPIHSSAWLVTTLLRLHFPVLCDPAARSSIPLASASLFQPSPTLRQPHLPFTRFFPCDDFRHTRTPPSRRGYLSNRSRVLQASISLSFLLQPLLRPDDLLRKRPREVIADPNANLRVIPSIQLPVNRNPGVKDIIFQKASLS